MKQEQRRTRYGVSMKTGNLLVFDNALQIPGAGRSDLGFHVHELSKKRYELLLPIWSTNLKIGELLNLQPNSGWYDLVKDKNQNKLEDIAKYLERDFDKLLKRIANGETREQILKQLLEL